MKKYPFNIEKHAHDFMFQSNRAFCIMHDMEAGTVPFDEAEYTRLEQLRHDLSAAELYFTPDPISFWPCRWYGLANAATVSAAGQRAVTKEQKRSKT